MSQSKREEAMELSSSTNGKFSELMEELNKSFERSHHVPRKIKEKTTTSRHILENFVWGTSIKKKTLQSPKQKQKLSSNRNESGFSQMPQLKH